MNPIFIFRESMQTRALRTLVTISRVNTFVEAAERLNMTLSAVSMQMKALEADLGVALFDRAFRPPKLTPIGREVVEQAMALLASEDQLQDLCRSKDELVGHFRIGFVPTASVRLLPGFLDQASRHVPRARFDVAVDVSEVLESKVSAGQMDAAVITASASPMATLRYVPLRTENMVFAVPRSRRDELDRSGMNALPFLQFTPTVGIGILIASYMNAQSAPKPHQDQKRLVLNSVEAIMECVNQGIGYTLLPEPDVIRYADSTATELVQPQHGLARRLVLAIPPSAPIGRRIDTVMKLFS